MKNKIIKGFAALFTIISVSASLYAVPGAACVTDADCDFGERCVNNKCQISVSTCVNRPGHNTGTCEQGDAAGSVECVIPGLGHKDCYGTIYPSH